ncbi:hypothetical protein [Dyadobacter sp. MSC1_007]|jgi:hypothetical protein|uniref:hypothetical protein n=1 Tax=Dyadobacter sp. MSC1_007 TaxID=2909264 RepID=UPI00202E32C7|nr:hypothetical protein [Dyadobacter sp. MSC1_007]
MSPEQKDELLRYVIKECGVGKHSTLNRLRPPQGFSRDDLWTGLRKFDQDGYIEVEDLKTTSTFYRLIVNDEAESFLGTGGYTNYPHSLAFGVQPSTINYHINGPNARLVTGNSVDNSTNTVNFSNPDLFDALIETISTNAQMNQDLITLVHQMKETRGTQAFTGAYTNFISLAANHLAIFTPYLPALTKFLTSLGT